MWIRLKLMAPLQMPRAPRALPPEDSSASPLDLDFLGMVALRADQGRFTRNRGAPDLLIQRGAMHLDLGHGHGFPSPALDGAVDGFDDRHVDEAFLAGRLRTLVRPQAFGEMNELGRELVA